MVVVTEWKTFLLQFDYNYGFSLYIIGEVQCEAEHDSVWGIVFPATVAGFSYSQQCDPQNGNGTTSGITIIPSDCVDVYIIIIGTATRFCTLGGVWEAVNIDNCTREVFSLLNDRVRLLIADSVLYFGIY